MLDVENLFASPGNVPEELFEPLLRGGAFRMERIVSTGQTTPEGQWYDQESNEWVVVVQGAARLRFEDGEVELGPGDFVNIPSGCRHRVEWTDPDQPTIWLAIHYLT